MGGRVGLNNTMSLQFLFLFVLFHYKKIKSLLVVTYFFNWNYGLVYGV